MGFFDAVGKIVNPKNILTAAGTVVAGPWGAAAGRGLGEATFGDDWDWRGDDAGGVGDVIVEGGKGAGMAYLAPQAVGGSGGAGKFVSGMKDVIGGGSSVAVPEAAGTVGGGGLTAGTSMGAGVGSTAASGGGGLLSGLSGMEKLYLGSQAVSGLGDLYGSYQQGRLEDERREQYDEVAQLLAPYYLEGLRGLESR